MDKRVLLFLVFLNLKPFAQGIPDSWIGIDCGSNISTPTNGILWQTDESFIETGTNHRIPDNTPAQFPILNTLRLFKEQNKNCYTLPASTMTRFFIRAAFFYGNYDGLSNPPTFDLQIDGNKWDTVVTSSTEAQYYEILYWCERPNISVCVARTQNDHFPFISSLETWSIPDSMYTGMSQNLAWLNNYRYNYGPENDIIWYPDDSYNRIWEPMSVPGAVNTTGDPGSIYDDSDEYIPDSVTINAIEAQNGTSLSLVFSPMKTNAPIFIEAYFTETLTSDTRSFDVYIDGKNTFTVTPNFGECTAERALVQASTTALTVELKPTETTLLPPIISAIEIYTASDLLITNGTHQDDLHGLEAFRSTFDRLKGWSGEPCLPADTVWQWLSCSRSDPPRVTSIHLSGYELTGTLPDFSEMQALEDIDLSNNSLSGQIPRFLGQLPNLKILNLSYNDFSGTIPLSIRNNKRLTFDISGNPNFEAKGNKSKVIGLAVGIPLLVIVLILGLVFWLLIRKRAKRDHNQESTGPETGNGPPSPTAPTEPIMAEKDNQDHAPVNNVVEMKQNVKPMVPEMDLDELEETIDHLQTNLNKS